MFFSFKTDLRNKQLEVENYRDGNSVEIEDLNQRINQLQQNLEQSHVNFINLTILKGIYIDSSTRMNSKTSNWS